MAIFKCKICGGDLDVDGISSIVTCEYCGTKQTLPRLDDNRKANLYDRANHFRRNNEFDAAMAIYEQILAFDNTDAESYWSLVLCRYGIEYVEDPATHKRVPTVNRAQFASIFSDEDYISTIKYADTLQRIIYEQEAHAISCPTLCDPIDGSPPGSPPLGFSRQEHWSGLPFPSPMRESEK